jgi:hypothetical protein
VAKRRQWQRVKFDTSEDVIRAIGMRAALEGVTQAEVINAALRDYLAREVALARERIEGAGTAAGEGEKATTRRKRDSSGD